MQSSGPLLRGALDKGKFPLRDASGPSGLVWQGFSIKTDCWAGSGNIHNSCLFLSPS